MAMASRPKARLMVFSRPMWSETQPQKGRHRPLITRSAASAKGRAKTVQPRMLTGVLSTLKSLAMGASCAVANKGRGANGIRREDMSERGREENICPEGNETAA